MIHLRPQIVAAASTPAEQTAVDSTGTYGRLPRLGRFLVLSVSVVSLWALASPAAATVDRRAGPMRPLEQGVLAKLNDFRRQHGLGSLRISFDLAAVARQHSTEMASRGYFGHSSANGLSFDRRIARSYPMGNHRYWSVGENLLWSSPELNAAAALNIWLNSPKHRKNMLMTRWREVGVGAVQVDSAPGVYGGREVIIVTADFGVRR
jgi:uncharacterized protein YkwD